MHTKPRNKMFRRKSKPNQNRTEAIPKSLDEKTLRTLFASSADVVITNFPNNKKDVLPALILYCEGMIDTTIMTQYVFPDLMRMLDTVEDWDQLTNELSKSLKWSVLTDHSQIVNEVFSGKLVVFFPTEKSFYLIDISQMPKRQPEESNTEVSLKGARDGFTEDIGTNVALIRKRLRTASLNHEQLIIGTRSQTKVSLLYIEDIARPEVIDEVRSRLNGLKVDALLNSGQLEEGISDSSLALFPLVDYIGRPDFATECLLKGRFIILVDGSPMALIAPCNLLELLKTPEDSYFPYHFVIFERILRLIGLAIALFLPGFWVALTSYNMDQIPFPLLATVTNSRFGLPFSAPMEILLMLGMFELFREAGVRLPKAVGQTIAVLGGLIIGDASIRAGLTSPTMLVVSATTAVATFTLVNQTLSGTVSIIRIYILFWSSILGLLGFFVGMLSVVAYLSILESFGLPYLAPVSPLTTKDLMSAILTKPWALMKKRPEILNLIDDTSQEGKSE